jgi:hypothetical protein
MIEVGKTLFRLSDDRKGNLVMLYALEVQCHLGSQKRE